MDLSTNILPDIEKFTIFSGLEIYYLVRKIEIILYYQNFRSNIQESPSKSNEINLNI